MGPLDGDHLHFDERMSDLEAILWELEVATPAVSPTMTVAVTFDGRPDSDALVDKVESMTRRLPRLRDRVAPALIPTAPPRWERDPDFDLDNHLVTSRLQRPVEVDGVLRLAERVVTTKLDRQRPPWQLHVVEGSGEGGALIIKLHHSLTDGLGAVKLASELFDLEPSAVAEAVDPVAEQVQPSPSPWRLVWDDLRIEARRGFGSVRAAVPWAAASLRDAAVDPAPRAQAVFELVRSLRTMADAAARPGSPVLAARSTGVRLAAVTLPLSDLRESAGRAGGTVNDVFVAGVLSGLGRYHAKRGSYPHSLRLGIPISTRGEATEADMHNQFAPMLLAAPLQLDDPVERVRLLHELILAARRNPALDLLDDAVSMVRRSPGAGALIRKVLSSIDVMASNVPGSPVDLYLGGAMVRQVIPIGPRAGAGLNFTLLSHHDSVHIGINMDPACIPDPDVMVECVRLGFDETLS